VKIYTGTYLHTYIYQERWYVGQILCKTSEPMAQPGEEYLYVSYMERSDKDVLKWPLKVDKLNTHVEDILMACKAPSPLKGTSSTRSVLYTLSAKEVEKANTLFDSKFFAGQSSAGGSKENQNPKPVTAKKSLPGGGMVVALYEGEWFPAEVLRDQSGVAAGYVRLSYAAVRGINAFAWPDMADIVETVEDDIIIQEVTLVPINSRGYFGLPKKEYAKVCSMMVVVYFFVP